MIIDMSNYDEDLGIEALKDRFVLSARINQEKDLVVIETSTGTLYLTWEGSCCSKCFLANVSGSEALINSTILNIENTEWKTINEDKDDYKVLESMGTTIKTTKGYVTFETRLDHNGYYSGRILVSSQHPLDQYSDPIDITDEVLAPLQDF